MLHRRDFLKGLVASGMGINITRSEDNTTAAANISDHTAAQRGCEISTIVRVLRANFLPEGFIVADDPMQVSVDTLWIDASGELTVLFIAFWPKTETEARRILSDLKENALYSVRGRYEFLKHFGAHYLNEPHYQAVPLAACNHERKLLFSETANKMIADRDRCSKETANLLAEVDSWGWPKEVEDIIKAEISECRFFDER